MLVVVVGEVIEDYEPPVFSLSLKINIKTLGMKTGSIKFKSN